MSFIENFFKYSAVALMTVALSASAEEAENNFDTVRYLGVEVSNVVLSTETSSGEVVYALPGELVLGYADCVIHRPTHAYEHTQVIVGLDGIGAQDGLGYGDFVLTAPEKPGIYEVRFRYAQAYTLDEAIDNWWEVDSAPPEQATIGLVIVTEDPESVDHEINNSNWKDWLHEQYASKEQIADDIEIITTLTADIVGGAEFWNTSKTTGEWSIDDNVLSNGGTLRYNEYNQIVSQQAFEQFNLRVIEEYQHTRNLETAWWSHSRGFGILYYVSDDRNVEFRYFADIGQLSLYVRDGEKVIERMQSTYFPPGSSIAHDISIDKGMINWQVNGKVIFQETTSLQQGRLMLTNHNNAVTFKF